MGSWIPCKDMRSAGRVVALVENLKYDSLAGYSGQLANPSSWLPSPFALVKRGAIRLRCAEKRIRVRQHAQLSHLIA